MKINAIVLVFLVVVISEGNPADAAAIITTTPEAHYPTCPFGANVTEYRCYDETMPQRKCDVEAAEVCRCENGLRCEFDRTFKGTEKERCIFTCKIYKPEAHGLLHHAEFDENVESSLTKK